MNQEDGITILISSHLLAEIEKLVTHVGIINQGRLLFQGTLGITLNFWGAIGIRRIIFQVETGRI